MKKKNKKKEDEIYNDCWLYVLLLTTLVILLESIKKYTFSIGQANLTYGIFLLPIQYFIVSYIAKKYDYKKAISAIAISGVFLVCFSATISFFLKESLILTNVLPSRFTNSITLSFLPCSNAQRAMRARLRICASSMLLPKLMRTN